MDRKANFSHRVVNYCAYCGGSIYNNERTKVTTTDTGVHHYHFDHGIDCLAREREAREIMHQMEMAFEEIDYEAERGRE